MPLKLIRWSIQNRLLVIIASVILLLWGWNAARDIPLDAIPDLSDVQIIIKTSYPGQAPRVVEDQVTYPITTTMLSVAGATAVRGYSFFGDSYVYVIFEDGVDPYWARSRVLEYLNQVVKDLPEGVQPHLGPDATGVGWIYNYALVDRTGRYDLSELRSLQDWFIKQELQTVPGVAEVASVGGMVRQYQIIVDPEKLRAYEIPVSQVIKAVRAGNREVGGSVIELGEAEYVIRTRGYIASLQDIQEIPLDVTEDDIPILLGDVAHIQIGPEMRRAVAELDGEGEVAGGIVVMRYGGNALETITAVKQLMEVLKQGLPEGVEIVETYDRSTLIKRAVKNLSEKLVEEFIVVALVCILFLFHLRSAIVAIVTLPLGIFAAFIIMSYQGVNANIMSLGGIAIAIGAMVDAAIVMIENAHRHLERHPGTPSSAERWEIIARAASEVGPALFYSLLIITLSFIPVFALQAQEGRLFSPLAYTKTYSMAAAAGLSVTLIPVLMGYLIRGRIPKETSNPINRFLIAIYRPLLRRVLSSPGKTLLISLLLVITVMLPIYGFGGIIEPLKWPLQLVRPMAPKTMDTGVGAIQSAQDSMAKAWQRLFKPLPKIASLAKGIGHEFMPELFEGDLMYMPTTLPGLSIGKARELLQQTDRLIKTIPEVKQVFGKIGRSDTATDPAPLTMIETMIQLKPKAQWRSGLTLEKLVAELDQRVQIPGLTNAWIMPIKTRIDMLSTGIKTPVGIKIAGPDIHEIERIGRAVEQILLDVPGTLSAYSERVATGRYIEIIPKRREAARLGLNIDDINQVVSAAVGGINIASTVEGRERYPINVRFPREQRDDPVKLSELPLVTTQGAQINLSQVAEIKVVDGPPVLKSENARLNGWVFVDIRNIDLGGYVQAASKLVMENLDLPTGYSITWSGQYEYLLRAKQRLQQLIPLTLAIIFVLLYLIFRRGTEALIVMLSLPFSLIGGFWLMWLLGYEMSVATAVGFIALAGVAAEFGVVMLVYLDRALEEKLASRNSQLSDMELKDVIMVGAVLRVRPKAMTVAVIIAGLLPIMFSSGTGSEVMQRIAAPMVGGMITAPLLSLFVIPAIYLLWKRRELNIS